MDMETNVIRHDLDWQKEKSQGDAWLHGWLTDHKTTTAAGSTFHVAPNARPHHPSWIAQRVLERRGILASSEQVTGLRAACLGFP